MIILQNKDRCIGCSACADKCPKSCIKMISDTEGFLYPEINDDVCIDCGSCKKACPLNRHNTAVTEPEGYAAYNVDDRERQYSSSGGIFGLLARYVLDSGGVVFGAALDEEQSVRHIKVCDTDSLPSLYGSKYVQSNTQGIFAEVKKELDHRVKVLFTGTPCQISALKSYLGREYPELICQGVVCHGVPSPGLWHTYIEYLEKNKDSKVRSLSFRDKVKGWKNFSFTAAFENGDKYTNVFNEDLYMNMFLKNFSLRKSCYDCEFKGFNNDCDILLADFWGASGIVPDMNDDRGLSLVVVNTPLGEELFDSVKKSMKYRKINIDDTISHNPALITSVKEPKNRTKFFASISEIGIAGTYNKYVKPTRMDLLKSRLRWYTNKLKRIIGIK